MGGKKKSLANKLAKMSDEERARYLQHKADMEEEARRRKEQLISTFLKKKIKREEMFSRLNLAKINQHWHQYLRKTKCQEMKQNVEHMKNWIERMIDYKNRTISKLVEELEEAEEQYSNNFQSHSTYINNILEIQQKDIEKLQKQYDDDLKQLLESAKSESDGILKTAQTEEEYLKTVLFEVETEGKKTLKLTYETYKQKEYEAELEFNERMTSLTTSRESAIEAIWRQIAAVVDLYVEKMDTVRVHYVKLRKFDADSAAEAVDNEERITRQEELIESLKEEDKNLFADRDNKLKAYRKELDEINLQFLKVKQRLQRELQIDEKKLKLLADVSNSTLENLENLNRKGDQIKNLASTCEKFKTQREIVSRWLPVTISEGFIKIFEDESADVAKEDLESVQAIIEEDLPSLKKLEDPTTSKKPITRPKTAFAGRRIRSSTSVSDVTTPESKKMTTVKKVVLRAKDSQDGVTFSLRASPSTERTSPDIVERCLSSLKCMENFWFVFNKTEVDFMELKDEKKKLEEENKQLRGMIRAVLERAVLAQSIPNSRVPTRVPSKRRSAQSAPYRRAILA